MLCWYPLLFLAVFWLKLFSPLLILLTSPHCLSWSKSHLMSIFIILFLTTACSTRLGVPAMSFFLWLSTPSYLLDQLSMSYFALILSIRVIAAMIPWHVVLLYSIMLPSLRTPLIFLLHLKMFTFYHHLIHHLLSPLEFLLIRPPKNRTYLFLQPITLVQSLVLLYR